MHLTGLAGMPRRVFTYSAGTGIDTLNLVSTIGAFVLAAGVAVLVVDVLRPRRRQPYAPRNPWNAGTLEWLTEMPGKGWGVRSVPHIGGRYPLWDDPHLLRDVDNGRYYLPDAEEGRRETLATSTLDARPTHCLRVPGPSWLPLWAAVFTGGAFIFMTYSWYLATGASALLAMLVILWWLWTGTAQIPEKPAKDVGLGVTLPLYASGHASPGWWAMAITMVADMAAFASLVFGYFFYWSVHAQFPPPDAPGPGTGWPLLALALVLGAWVLTLLARHCNRRGSGAAFHAATAAAALLACAAVPALLAGPQLARMDPTAHVYPAIVWVLLGWTAVHVALGVLMHGYCMLRRLAGRMDGVHDIDIQNVVLYWHFVAATALVAVAVVAGFPLLA